MNNDGLCSLHREKGEGYLPEICRLYPRSLKQINDVGIASCSSSCERVVEMLRENDALNIGEIKINEEPKLFYEVDKEDIRKMMVFDDLLKKDDETLSDKIAMICKIINKEEFEKDYFSDEDPVNCAIRLLSRFSSSNEVLDKIIGQISERYKEDNSLFEKDRTQFEKNFPDWMDFFERVINNSVIYECFPFVDKKS